MACGVRPGRPVVRAAGTGSAEPASGQGRGLQITGVTKEPARLQPPLNRKPADRPHPPASVSRPHARQRPRPGPRDTLGPTSARPARRRLTPPGALGASCRCDTPSRYQRCRVVDFSLPALAAGSRTIFRLRLSVCSSSATRCFTRRARSAAMRSASSRSPGSGHSPPRRDRALGQCPVFRSRRPHRVRESAYVGTEP